VILGIPILNRPDLFAACIDSIDIPVQLVVIDNSPEGFAPEYVPESAWVVQPPSNLGVAASWNLVIATAPKDPYWLIANADTRFGPGDLARLCAEMEQGGPRWVGMNGDWRVFGITAECVERVGWFDPNFAPIYCEDADYEYRCSLAGVPWYFLNGGAEHVGSVSYRSDERNARHNARTYPENLRYYQEKWGGSPRGGEAFTSPWNLGGHVGDWRLRLERLRANAWD
jgi:GT2 family glycosyltransferase